MIRLRGLFIIVNCVMPIILVGALALFAATLWGVVETELNVLAYNIKRMIALVGVKGLMVAIPG